MIQGDKYLSLWGLRLIEMVKRINVSDPCGEDKL